MYAVTQVVSAIAAIVAAVLWFWSALLPLPKNITAHAVPVGGGVSSVHSKDLRDLGLGLKKQSRLSAYAAASAAVAALAQALGVYVSLGPPA